MQFEASIIDAARGVKTHVVGPVRGSRADASQLVASLANRVAATLAASHDSTPGGATAQLVEAPSIQAYEHASRGWEMFFSRPQDTSAAFAELARAMEEDSLYVAPLLMRGYILDVKGRWDDLGKLVAKLEPLRPRMARTEREAVALFEADLRGDLLERLRASRELARLNPGSPDMALLVAISASYLNRAEEADASLRSTRVDGGVNQVSPMYWAWRAATSHTLGKYDEELAAGTRELEMVSRE